MPDHRSRGCRECARLYAAAHYAGHERAINRRRAAAREFGDPARVAIGRARAYVKSLVDAGKCSKLCVECGDAAAHVVLEDLGDYADTSRPPGPPRTPPSFFFACAAHRRAVRRRFEAPAAEPHDPSPQFQTIGEDYEAAAARFATLTPQQQAGVLAYAARTPWGTSLRPETPMYLMRFASAVRRLA